jgi:long-chain acyl-CoA synthetase
MGARPVVPKSRNFKPDEIAALAPKLQNVSMFAAPTMVRRLIEFAKADEYDGEGIKTIIYGGGPMYQADILAALDQFGNRFVQIYGQGESPMAITSLPRFWHQDTSHPRYLQRLASVGLAQSVVEVRIADNAGAPLPVGEIGEIEVRGPTVMRGYWNNPQATSDTLKDGWLKTGDVGTMDADGFFTLSDRSKDVIISGGSNIYPREVEEILLRHKDVAEVAVIGRPHPDWGEEIVACLSLEPGSTLDVMALDALCLDNIARFKRPKDYLEFQALPKNNYGKILKKELRKIIMADNNNEEVS